jgi:enterochelin esterase-like enzyme
MAQKPFRFAFLFLATLLVFALPATITPPITTYADGGGIINFGESVRGDLLFDERDTWTFRGQAGQRVSLVVEHDTDGFLDPDLELRDPSNMPLLTDTAGGVGRNAALLGVVLPEDGLYAVVVLAAEGTEGNYTLTLAETNWPANCTDTTGTLITEDLFSAAAGEQLRYSVYLPPCADATSKRYPYVLLMHGSDRTDTHWDNLGMDEAIAVGYALGQIPPVALVLPYGGEIANLNYFGPTYSYENVLLNEFMPAVEDRFCLQTTGNSRAIGGISRGGFWAWSLGMRHPERFAAVGGHSPIFAWEHARTHNPLFLTAEVEITEDFPRLYVDRGRDDWWAFNIDLMAPQLERHNIPATVLVNENGTHDDTYWRRQLHAYLEFYTADWTANWETYPDCS